MANTYSADNTNDDRGKAFRHIVFMPVKMQNVTSLVEGQKGIYYNEQFARFNVPDIGYFTYRQVNGFRDVYDEVVPVTNIVGYVSQYWSMVGNIGNAIVLHNGQYANIRIGELGQSCVEFEFSMNNNRCEMTYYLRKGNIVVESGTSAYQGTDTVLYLQAIAIGNMYGFMVCEGRNGSTNLPYSFGTSYTGAFYIRDWQTIFINLDMNIVVDETGSDDEFGDFGGTGGYSGYDPNGRNSEQIGIPDAPPSVSSLGFLNVYKITEHGLDSLIDEIFPTVDFPDIPEGGGALGDVVHSINLLVDNLASAVTQFSNGNLLKDILDTHIIPVSVSGVTDYIKVGYKTTTCRGERINNDYIDVDCGTINVKEVYSNYVDYIGTRAKLFLPFVGYVDLKPEYWQNGTIHIIYRFSVINGSFVCWVMSTSSKSSLYNSVIGEYTGSACLSVPLNGTDYTQVLSGVASAVTSMASGNVIGGVTDLMSGISTNKPEQQHNGSYNMSSSFMGMKRPYLIIERQVPQFPQSYAHEKGLPLNSTYKLSNLKGFTMIESVDLNTLTCTQEEKDEIQSLLKGGVYL